MCIFNVVVKYILAFTVLYFTTVISDGQAYQKFVVEGAHWEMYERNCPSCHDFEGDSWSIDHWLKIEGDTVVGGMAYKKFYDSDSGQASSPNFPTVYFHRGWRLTGLVREDTIAKKVYLFGNLTTDGGLCRISNTDTLLYDFSTQIGDSVRKLLTDPYDNCFDSVFVADSINYSGFQNWSRRTVYLDPTGQAALAVKGYKMIEGIGPSFGLFGGPETTFEQTYWTYLISYCVGPDSICGRGFTAITDINDFKPEIVVQIFPNPANNLFFLEAAESIEQFELINLTGQIIETENPNTTKVGVNIRDLPGGIYFCRILMKDGVVTKKIFIN
ncbi:MAG: hypothetical protein JWO06_198 [Bacteroidota bacterium]|nr:hypothetical protein [Bacteroidota bacterium]